MSVKPKSKEVKVAPKRKSFDKNGAGSKTGEPSPAKKAKKVAKPDESVGEGQAENAKVKVSRRGKQWIRIAQFRRSTEATMMSTL
jgi:hypothetical protein